MNRRAHVQQLDLLAPPPRPVVERTEDLVEAITLWQPFAHAIAFGAKRIENREWSLWERIRGTRQAIHAGDKVHPLYLAMLNERFGYSWRAEEMTRKGIVATAVFADCLTASDDPWFMGPFGFVLCDVIRLQTPVMCPGKPIKFWKMSDAIRDAVRAESARGVRV